MSITSTAVLRTLQPIRIGNRTETANTQQADAPFREHATSVERYACAMLHDRAEAEDIAQECFVRLMQTLQRGIRVERPLPWLMRVAHNLALDAIARRPREVMLGLREIESISDPVPDPEAALLELDRRSRVQQALTSLSAQELRCWTLRAEGLRYREIAEVLGIRSGTVSTFLVRAAEKLSSV